jgi:hypothetical protein
MSESVTPSTSSTGVTGRSRRSLGALGGLTITGLLLVAFVFRAVQYGTSWMRGMSSAEQNFKVLTFWCLGYAALLAVISLAIWKMSVPEDDSVET